MFMGVDSAPFDELQPDLSRLRTSFKDKEVNVFLNILHSDLLFQNAAEILYCTPSDQIVYTYDLRSVLGISITNLGWGCF